MHKVTSCGNVMSCRNSLSHLAKVDSCHEDYFHGKLWHFTHEISHVAMHLDNEAVL